MKVLVLVAAVVLLAPSLTLAQATGENREVGRPGDAGSRREPVVKQHGDQPNPGEVRPGAPAGDAPSASAGDLVRRQSDRRILDLPVTTALVVSGIVVALFVIGGLIIPATRRRARAGGNGTCGPPS